MSRTTEENNSSLVSLAAQLQLFFSRNIFLFFFSVFFREYFKSDIILDNIFSHLPLLTVFFCPKRFNFKLPWVCFLKYSIFRSLRTFCLLLSLLYCIFVSNKYLSLTILAAYKDRDMALPFLALSKN